MTVRHAAALALVGWYLMLPPVIKISESEMAVGVDRPLAEWTLWNSFDSAEECAKKRDQFEDDADAVKFAAKESSAKGREFKPPDNANATIVAGLHSLCIASDDPRLKEK